MELVFSIITSLAVATTGILGMGNDIASSKAPRSVEIGLAELSPAGEAGGYAMPASGCSSASWHGIGEHDCTQLPSISVDNPVIRSGDETVVRWNPNGNTDCVVMGTVTPTGVVSTNGSQTVSPTSDTTYVIICANNEEISDTVTVRVLPRIQET